MPELNRTTLQRLACPRCRISHGVTVACPPFDVWLMAWSLRVNGRRR